MPVTSPPPTRPASILLALLALAVTALPACSGASEGTRTRSAAEASPLQPLTVASVRAHLRLPEGEAGREERYAQAVVTGHRIMVGFAAQHGWSEAAAAPTFDSVEVFATREELWRRVLEIYEAPSDTEMPGTGPVAGLEGRVLMSVSEEEHRRAHPEYAAAPESLARVFAHEMVHRLHVAILDGDDDAMGPRWFYEGFAVLGSGQDFDLGHVEHTSAAEALAEAHRTDDPDFAYRRYAAALRYFTTRIPLEELVTRAGRADFEDSLRALDEAEDGGGDEPEGEPDVPL